MPRVRRVAGPFAGMYVDLTTGGSGCAGSPAKFAFALAIVTLPSVFCMMSTRPTTAHH